ncbi:hypothetical protein ACSMFQ_04215 [Ectopseudomonas chengduensis]
METDEIANPVPTGFFCADALMMQTHHRPELLYRRGLLGVSVVDSLAVFLHSGNGMAKRGSQANTSGYQGLAGNALI